jgi:hypothetical protein
MKPRIVRANEGSTKIASSKMFAGHVLHDQVFVPESPSRLRVSRMTFHFPADGPIGTPMRSAKCSTSYLALGDIN